MSVHAPLNPSELVWGDMIGKGAAAGVWQVGWKGGKYAVKKFYSVGGAEGEDGEGDGKGERWGGVMNEVAMMSILDHPNVVRCQGACFEGGRVFLLTELFERNSLLSVLEDVDRVVGELSVGRLVGMAEDVAMGMEYLHSVGVIHRDLKPDNLLVGEDWRVAVSDLGVSKVISGVMTMAVGSSLYIAPEVFESNAYTDKVDVYGFGYVLWGMWERKEPFSEYSTFQLIGKVVEEGERPVVGKGCVFGELMVRCWQEDPNLRPSFSEIVRELKKIKLEVGEGGGAR